MGSDYVNSICKEEIMRLSNVLWDSYIQTLVNANPMYKDSNGIILSINTKQKIIFLNNFCNRYMFVMDTFMASDVKFLDRHKVAAIAIIEFIESNVLTYECPKINNNMLFIPEYILALQTGLAFMQRMLNILLESQGMNTVDKWHWPTSLSCPNNEFILIMARHLYFTKKRSTLGNERYATNFNELDLAERLFYIEWITLKEKMIDYRSLMLQS